MLKRKTKQTAKEASEEWMDISGKFQITNILAKLKQWKHKKIIYSNAISKFQIWN